MKDCYMQIAIPFIFEVRSYCLSCFLQICREPAIKLKNGLHCFAYILLIETWCSHSMSLKAVNAQTRFLPMRCLSNY